ncbi:MAG: hypothetical protein ACR2K5_11960 [Pseudolabrys sp.]
MSRLTGALQLLGSLIGIPLALASGYSIYKSNFSADASCQSLRASIISMLDKKADASTLRMLVHRDVVTFERECGAVDAEAVAAFKSLLTAERAASIVPDKLAAGGGEPATKTVKTESTKTEPAKSESAKPQGAIKVEGAKPAVVNFESARVEPPRGEAAKNTNKKTPAAFREETVDKVERKKPTELAKPLEPTKPVEPAKAADAAKPAELKPAEMAKAAEPPAERPSASPDANWIASVREALRDSASRPANDPAAEVATPVAPPPMSPAIVVPALPATMSASARGQAGSPVPPADIPTATREPDHPVPPASIPNVDNAEPAPAR